MKQKKKERKQIKLFLPALVRNLFFSFAAISVVSHLLSILRLLIHHTVLLHDNKLQQDVFLQAWSQDRDSRIFTITAYAVVRMLGNIFLYFSSEQDERKCFNKKEKDQSVQGTKTFVN